MKYKKLKISKIENLLEAYNVFVQSCQDTETIVKEFNNKVPRIRNQIKKDFSFMEAKKRKYEIKDSSILILLTITDFQIIASKYDVDPATVALFINPPCKINERILMV